MTAAHLLLGALLEGTGPGDAMRGRRVRRCRSRARRSLLLLPEELLHGADVNLVLLLPHRQRPDVGLPAHLLLWYGLPEEAANSTLLPAVGGRGRGRRRRRRSWRRRRQGRRGRCWGPGVAGRISDGVRVSGHRGRGRGSGVGGGSGAAAPLAAAALWLIGCGRATHNKHPKTKQPAQVQRWLKKRKSANASFSFKKNDSKAEVKARLHFFIKTARHPTATAGRVSLRQWRVHGWSCPPPSLRRSSIVLRRAFEGYPAGAAGGGQRGPWVYRRRKHRTGLDRGSHARCHGLWNEVDIKGETDQTRRGTQSKGLTMKE